MATASQHNVGHFEIPADRTGELKSFYSSLFGWQFEKGQTEDCILDDKKRMQDLVEH